MSPAGKAQQRAHRKYIHEKIDEVKVRLPKGEKAVSTEHAVRNGESLNAFAVRALHETMERDESDGKSGEKE